MEPHLPTSFVRLHVIFFFRIRAATLGEEKKQKLISDKQVKKTKNTASPAAYAPNGGKKKEKNQYPKGVEKHFIFITFFFFFSNSQQINYSRLPALPKFPPSTSISQSVYCLSRPFLPPPLRPPARLSVRRRRATRRSSEMEHPPSPPPRRCCRHRRRRRRLPLSGASFLKHALRQWRGATRGQSHAHFCE